MELNLADKVAFVTGGSRGLGKVIARTLSAEGVQSIISGRDRGRLAQAKAELEQVGANISVACGDMTDADDVKRIFETIVERIGRLDILVNTVGGVEKFGNFETLEPSDWNQAFALNCMSMVLCTRSAIPWLRKSDAPRIINISTVPARQPGSFNPHYSAAKAAMLNVNKYLANALAKDKILVNAICPSTLWGDSWQQNVKHRSSRDGISQQDASNRMEEEEKKKNPLGEMGSPEDVASLVTFLASSRARFITGTVIDVDGGTVRSIL